MAAVSAGNWELKERPSSSSKLSISFSGVSLSMLKVDACSTVMCLIKPHE